MRRFLIRPADPFLITWDLTSVTSVKQDSPKSRTFQNTFSWFTKIRVRSKASYLLPFVCGYLKLRIIHFRNDVSSCKYVVVKQSCWKILKLTFQVLSWRNLTNVNFVAKSLARNESWDTTSRSSTSGRTRPTPSRVISAEKISPTGLIHLS